MKFRIRNYRKSDLESVNMIYHSGLLHILNLKKFQFKEIDLDSKVSQFEDSHFSQFYKCFVGLLNDKIIGFIDGDKAYLEDIDNSNCRYWEINNLYVSEPFRYQGFGRKLLNRMVKHAQSSGYTNIIIHSQLANVPATTLYINTGFQPVQVSMLKKL